MKLELENIGEIRRMLMLGETLEDLTILLNYIIELQRKAGSNYQSFQSKKVKYYYFNISKKYHEFKIPKKTGGERSITAPDVYLKKIQRRIAIILDCLYVPNESSHGFLANRSIITNAKPHVRKEYLLNLDLENFFPSVEFLRVRKVFCLKRYTVNPKMAHLLANFCCLNGKLPQGAPTSPVITNMVCQKLDGQLSKFSKKRNLEYTRYADDLTFSSNDLISEEYIGGIKTSIVKSDFKINTKKTRLRKRNMSQEVTGIVVNDKINVNRKYIRNLRVLIDYFQKGKLDRKKYRNVIIGKLMFLKMVKGEDEVYLKLNNKFKLHGKN